MAAPHDHANPPGTPPVEGAKEIELMSQDYFEDLRGVLEKDCRLYGKTIECYQYAQFLEYKDKKLSEAAPLYNMLCDEKNHAPSCLSSGMITLNTRGEVGGAGANYGPEAFRRFDQACARGEAKGCQNAGLLRKEGGHGVDKDVSAAVNLFSQACDGGERNGCYYLGLMHLTGKPDGDFTPDKMQALIYSSKACKLGHPWGCANVSRMLSIGDGVPVDLEQAELFKQRYLKIQRGELS
mmetsp:Transcript_6136/g.15685  ORF Transcript_6136/g.15685 Transcript_6136/m.15685 type:complete len:238 (-) Transcript_6136:177-890(-)